MEMGSKEQALFVLDASEVRVKQRWRHLKTDRIYTVIATGIEEATLTPVVIYAGPDGVVWTRPLASFVGERDDGKPRFVLLEEDETHTAPFHRVEPGLRELAEVHLP